MSQIPSALDTGRFCGRCGIHRVVTSGQLCPVCVDDEKRAEVAR